MTDISTRLTKVKLKNPTILAAGILGSTAASLKRIADSGAGAVTTKSIGPVRSKGNENPVIVEVPNGLINAIGLPSPNPEEAIEELRILLRRVKIPVIASIYGRTIQEFGEVSELVSSVKPAIIEVNISCPNIRDEKPFGIDPESSGRITEIVKDSTNIPVAVKLSPNVADIRAIARAVEDSGADIISAVNSLGPGMVIDIETANPILSNIFGGVSGNVIKPISVRCVYEIYEEVEIPIIGIGGISSGKDAVEMLMAGASAVGIGTAIRSYGIGVFEKISNEIKTFMKSHNYSKLNDIIGIAHK